MPSKQTTELDQKESTLSYDEPYGSFGLNATVLRSRTARQYSSLAPLPSIR